MNPSGFVKEEFPDMGSSCSGESSSMAVPRPMEGLHGIGPPPFLTKTYDLVDDRNTNHIISWSRGNNSFVVWEPQAFAMDLLPKYFKHNNFSSFVRQLNTYGFRKVDPDRWEFANEEFLRGQKHLLRNIRRRKTNSHSQTSYQVLKPCGEVGRFGSDEEVDRLRHDKQVLMAELVKLRQQQQNSKAYLEAMEERLSGTEMRQRQMTGFLARVIQNPSFLQQLTQHKERRKEIEEEICKKRRRPIDQGPTNVDLEGIDVKQEPYDYDDICELSDLELEQLVEREERQGSGEREEELDEGFWEGLLSGEGENEEDVDLLAEQLALLGSSPR